ncbi:MAG: nucleoside triphosphate pyrophosphohydrolase [Chitinophagales bacterium]|nr:nucleoside triphosphate pyrophosphohydrolase [Bacteroidota bacterium]MCB9043817.1 nucleoside triphosphate pyrophosphohydrolase [Chitinophagales bacterium]
MDKRLTLFGQLLQIMDELREQCPWDKEQTLESLSTLSIEETYELTDAIQNRNMQHIKEELGDLLLHIVFYAKIASESGDFDISDVIEALNEKLIRRHPHIYGDTKVKDVEEVLQNWEKIKLQEKGKKSALQGVPKAMPALPKAFRIQEKAKKVGFEWDYTEQVWAKVQEELGELQEAIQEKSSPQHIESEFGDVLFALVNYARFIGVDPETALSKTNTKFINRFQAMEQLAQNQEKSLTDMNLAEMDTLWNEVKKEFP